MHKSRLGNLVIDCCTDDLWQAAGFWSQALGCALPAQADPASRFIQLETKPGEVQIILQQVDHSPRVRLDIETDAIVAEIERVKKLGAVMVARHEAWVVMQAPTGGTDSVLAGRTGTDSGNRRTSGTEVFQVSVMPWLQSLTPYFQRAIQAQCGHRACRA